MATVEFLNENWEEFLSHGNNVNSCCFIVLFCNLECGNGYAKA